MAGESKKAQNRQKLVDYLSDPDNPEVLRSVWSKKILGYKQDNQIYKFFSTMELNEIEWEALDNRRKRYAPKLSAVDRAMLKEAKKGNANAGKLCYQRFESWSEKSTIQHGFDAAALNIILSALPEEYAEAVKAQLSNIIKK